MKHHPTMRERFEIYDFMREAIKPYDDGTCEYIGSSETHAQQSDQTVSNRFGFPLHVIQNIRMQGFGKLRKPAMPESIEDRLAAIDRRLEEISQDAVTEAASNKVLEDRIRNLELQVARLR